jgi:hypothetical protein
MKLRLHALFLLLLSLPAAAQAPDSLSALNDAFRQAYSGARRRVLAGDGPVLIVNGDNAVLVRGMQRSEVAINVPAYHVEKTIAHIPLAIFVSLTAGDETLDPERLQNLENLRRLIPAARSSLDGLNLSAPVLNRQDRIVRESLAFIDNAIAQRKCSKQELQVFTRRMSPFVMANVADAARAQLDILHAQVTAWRHEMSPAEWATLHVVIITAHMPREENIVFQYFARLLHEPREGRRIVVAESLFEEPKALDLYGTHLLDGSIGEAFFGDPMRMHRDLLADAAKDYLPKLLPQVPTKEIK